MTDYENLCKLTSQLKTKEKVILFTFLLHLWPQCLLSSGLLWRTCCLTSCILPTAPNRHAYDENFR